MTQRGSLLSALAHNFLGSSPTWYKATMLIQGGVDLTPLITHRFDCTEYAKGFEVMASGSSGKVILNWTQVGE